MITTYLSIIFGGTSVVAVIKYIIERRENKKLKFNEAVQSDTDAQSSQIDLGVKFIKSSAEAVEAIKNATLNTEKSLQELGEKFEDKITVLEKKFDMKTTNINRSLNSYNKKLSLVVKYLDGAFEEFLKAEAEKKGGTK